MREVEGCVCVYGVEGDVCEYVKVVCKRNVGSSLLDGSPGLKSKQDVGSV